MFVRPPPPPPPMEKSIGGDQGMGWELNIKQLGDGAVGGITPPSTIPHLYIFSASAY